jgi:glycosyltransferase involved in cell wall biosynthesis
LDKLDLEKANSTIPRERLRILLIVNLHWDARLGAIRVFMELEQAWRASGHTVERFTLDEAFPRGRVAPAIFALRQLFFGYKAAEFVKKNADRFDVIDALIGSLHGSKKRLGFVGLLVARSVGLYRLYERFERDAQARWPCAQGKAFGRSFYTIVGGWSRRASDAAVAQADLTNVPNEEEEDCLRQEMRRDLPIAVQPYGLTAEQRQALRLSAASPEKRLAHSKISFLGMWAPRKGSHDWPRIVRLVWDKIPETRFSFLGTMVDRQTILSDLGMQSSERIEVVIDYSQSDLPALLADSTVGAFPSYVEGFGIAVLEQLAAGIPTVAFDVAGPRDILGADLSRLLVPVGDAEKFAAALVEILQSSAGEYQELAKRSSDRASCFVWSEIAHNTATIYRDRLDHIEIRHSPKP